MSKKTDLQASTAIFRSAQPVEIRNGVARFENDAQLVMRSVEIRSNTANEAVDEASGKRRRTVEVVWTTGASVRRYDWWNDEEYIEELVVSDETIDLSRMNDGASVLNSHWGYDLESVLGVVESVRIEDGKGYATVLFSNRASVDELWGDIQDGIIRHISVGYTHDKVETVREEGKTTIKRIVRWTPHEISFVAIPADSGCSVRSQEPIQAPATRMETIVSNPADQNAPADGATTTETRTAPAVDAGAVRAAERARQSDIRNYAAAHAVDAATRDAALEGETTFEQFCRDHVNAVAAEARETTVSTNRTSASITNQRSPDREMELRSEALAAVEMQRAGLRPRELSEEAREFANDGMRGIAEACLRNAGRTVRQGASDFEVIGEAFQLRSYGGVLASSDITLALGEPVRAVLESGYESQIEETNFQSWAGSTTVSNFKPQKAIHMGLFTGIRDVSEGGQLPLAKLGAGARYFQLGTRGLAISFTREAIINDEFGVLLQAVSKLGTIYRHDEQTIAERALARATMTTENGEEDIFDEVYNNVVDVAALDPTGMKAAVLKLRQQRLGEEYGELRISVKPRKLLVSEDLEFDALKLVAPISAMTSDGVNPYGGSGISVDVISGLDEGTAFLTGSAALNDVIQTARLARAQGPQIERLPMRTIMSAEWESINDFTAFGVGRYGIVKINVTG